jgi:hypothetical protein
MLESRLDIKVNSGKWVRFVSSHLAMVFFLKKNLNAIKVIKIPKKI